MPVMTELYHFAKNLVLDCGRQLRARRREYGISIQEKTGHSDIVTDHDLWLQRRLCEEILKRYPDHGIIGEENMCREGTSLWKWIIDPIDGTTNYCQFGKDYAISVALFCSEQPIFGFVLDVENVRLYEAEVLAQSKIPECRETAEKGILHIGFKPCEILAAKAQILTLWRKSFAGCAIWAALRWSCAALPRNRPGFMSILI